MVQLPQALITELQEIVRTDYGKDLSLEETGIIAHGLVSYFDLLAKVHHRSKSEARNLPLSVALARADDESSAEARERPSLVPKTSM